MRWILKLVIVIILFIIIIAITIVPKLLSYAWYGTWQLNYTNSEYIVSITELITTIVESEKG